MSISVSIRCEIPVSSRPSIISISIDRYVSSSSASYFALHSLKASEDSLIRGGLTKLRLPFSIPSAPPPDTYFYMRLLCPPDWYAQLSSTISHPHSIGTSTNLIYYTTCCTTQRLYPISTNALLDLESNRDWTDPAVTLYICFTHRHWYLLLIKDTIIIVICTALELVISCYYYWGRRLLLVKANIPPSYLMFFYLLV